MWLLFLSEFNGIAMLSPDIWLNSNTLHLYSDSAKSIGFAVIFGNDWCADAWSHSSDYHITLLELYPIVLAVMLWCERLRNKNIIFFCDNKAVVDILNSQTSKDALVMKLVRKFVLKCMQYNINFHLQHIAGKQNIVSDALSRLQIHKARSLQPGLKAHPQCLPMEYRLSNLLL